MNAELQGYVMCGGWLTSVGPSSVKTNIKQNIQPICFLTFVRRHVLNIVHTITIGLHIGRFEFFKLPHAIRVQQRKDGITKGEVVPLVQPLVPHVDCSEVLDVFASPWLDVVHGGCHHCVQVLIHSVSKVEKTVFSCRIRHFLT